MKWDDLRIFLAVARAGSFSAAARTLGVNQSTVSRRLAAMERDLRAALFERGAEGQGLTPAGTELLVLAQRVEEAFLSIDRRVAGRDARLGGRLRVTCVDMMVERYLALHFAAFTRAHPEIELSVLSTFQPLDLSRGEADVAIRVSANPTENLVGRRLFGFAMAVYGAAEFAEAHPRNPNPATLDWIGWESEATTKRMITEHYPSARIRHRVDSLFVLSALVRAGLGAAVLPCYWADRDPDLRRLYQAPLADDKLGLWVLAHPDLRRAARVRAFISFVTEIFLADRALFEGRGG